VRWTWMLLVVVLVVVDVLSLWLWWEVHTAVIDWGRRNMLFPLPFYVARLPCWFLVDLAILLNVLCTAVLGVIALRACVL